MPRRGTRDRPALHSPGSGGLRQIGCGIPTIRLMATAIKVTATAPTNMKIQSSGAERRPIATTRAVAATDNLAG